MCGSARFTRLGSLLMSPGMAIPICREDGQEGQMPLSSHRFARAENPLWRGQAKLWIPSLEAFSEHGTWIPIPQGCSAMGIQHIDYESQQDSVSILTLDSSRYLEWAETANLDSQEVRGMIRMYNQAFSLHHRCPMVHVKPCWMQQAA